MKRTAHRGFSLIEISVVLVLISTITVALFINARSGGDRLKSQGLAKALSEELRAARAQATQDQTDVIVAFPAQTGGGACRSFRIYQGEDSLQPLRNVSFDSEFDSVVTAATWPTSGSWETTSTLPATRVFPVDKNIIVFRPDGSVQSNLPRLDGVYCLLVANAYEASGGSGLFGTLDAVKNPSTVMGP